MTISGQLEAEKQASKLDYLVWKNSQYEKVLNYSEQVQECILLR